MSNANMKATAILSAEDQASQVLAMVARNFDRLNKAANMKVNGAKQHGEINAALEKRNRLLSRMAVIGAATGNNLGLGLGGMAGAAMAGGPVVAGAVVAASLAAATVGMVKSHADNQRAMTRIGVTAEATREETEAAGIAIQDTAQAVAMAPDEVRKGFDSLVASGRQMQEALAFLPSVTKTAQASGAAVEDIARTADAVGNALKISSGDMQSAFDIMAVGGKLGKFELKDMAQYLPQLGSFAAQAGAKGTEGLTRLVAALQTTRMGAGSAEEAATNLRNVYTKMYSEETQNKFKKFANIDLRKRLDQAEASGEDLLETFVNITAEATKSGKVKIGQLFQDTEAQRGMNSLINNMGEYLRYKREIDKNSKGTVDRDLARVLKDNATAFDRAGASASRFAKNMGEALAPAVITPLNKITDALNAMNKAMERNKVLTQEMQQAGIKKLAEPETREQYERRKKAERLFRESDPAYLEEMKNMPDGGFHRRAPTLPKKGTLARMDYDHQRAVEARDALEKQKRYDADVSRRGFRGSESQLYDDQKNGTGAYSEVMKKLDAERKLRRNQGYSTGGLSETAALANSEITSLVQEIKDIEQSGLQNRPGQMQERYRGLKQSLRKKVEEADYNTAKENKTFKSSPEELDSKVKTLLESAKVEVKPDQITAKVEGEVTTKTIVEVVPSENFMIKVTSFVMDKVGNAFGSSPSTGGAVNP